MSKRVFEIDDVGDSNVDARLIEICINEHRRPEHAIGVRAIFPAAGDWRAIEEAPKDGTEVLLWHPDYVGVGQWDGGGWFGKGAVHYPNPLYFALVNPPKEGGRRE